MGWEMIEIMRENKGKKIFPVSIKMLRAFLNQKKKKSIVFAKIAILVFI